MNSKHSLSLNVQSILFDGVSSIHQRGTPCIWYRMRMDVDSVVEITVGQAALSRDSLQNKAETEPNETSHGSFSFSLDIKT